MYIRVHAVPGARKEKVCQDGPASYTIWVKEEARGNRANERIREMVAALCSVAPRAVRLLTGHRSSSKMYSVEAKGD
jgi:uncharacterized protein YggU (UPF0235/DUF167 family)